MTALLLRYSEFKYCALVTDESRGNEEITIIIKLVSHDNNNSFKLLLDYTLLENTKIWRY
jgi:hypothetical protein